MDYAARVHPTTLYNYDIMQVNRFDMTEDPLPVSILYDSLVAFPLLVLN